MDLTHFKKLTSDKHTTTIQHKDGHTVKIVHSALPPEHQEKLKAMPVAMADGGLPFINTAPEQNMSVDPNAAPEESPEPVPAAPTRQLTDQQRSYNANIDRQFLNTDREKDIPSMKFGPNGEEPANLNYDTMDATLKSDQKLKQEEENKQKWSDIENVKKGQLRQKFGLATSPEQIKAEENTQAKPTGPTQISDGNVSQQQNTAPTQDLSGMSLAALQQAMAATTAQQKAESQLGQTQATEAQKQADALADIDRTYKSGFAEKQNEISKILEDLKKPDSKINPNHYMENMSTPAKVQTAIGLLLGGIGGGMMHQENPALKFLNAQIDRDVQSQIDNRNGKLSIASHYNQLLGNQQAAASFAKATQMAIYASKLQEAAGKAADPMAKARAQQASAQLLQQAIPYLHQSQAYDMLYGNSGKNIDPAQKLLMMKNAGMVNDKQYEEGNKELAKTGEVEDLKNAYEASYNDLNSKFAAGTFSPRDRQSAVDSIAGRIMRLGEGRVNPEMAEKQAQALLPVGFEGDETRAKKLQRGHALFNSMVQAPTLTGLGLGPSKIKPINFKPRGQ